MNRKRYHILTLCLVVIFTFSSFPTNFAYAESTGPRFSTNATGWTNASNISAADNVYCTATMYASTQSPWPPIKAKGFNFDIPDGSTINGIEVSMERKQVKSTGSGFYDEMACLIINGVDVYASSRAVIYTYWPTTEGVKTFGGPNDTWGQTLTPQIVNDPNFGFYFNGRKITGTVTAYVDYISMTVYYTPPTLDTTAPVIATQSDITAEATGPDGSNVTFTPTATDNVDPNVTVVCTPASGSLFALGVTEVTCNATDTAGNAAIPVKFNVIVQDTTAPVITLNGTNPININQDTEYLELGATWIDAVDGTGAAIVAGDIVNTGVPGTYTVTYNYTDTHLNAANQATRTVNVLDTTAPVIATQSDITAEATGPDGANVTFTPTATDNVDPNVTVVCTPASGSLFALGVTEVTCNATDTAGNAAIPVKFNVTVQDTTAPVITLNGTDPYDVAFASTYVDPGATWSDTVDGTGTAIVGGDVVDTQVPGTYNITYDYTDAAGNPAIQVTRTVNVLPWSTINVTKDVLSWKGKPTNDPYVFTIQMDGANEESISENITATYDRLPPGTYTITELPEAKYQLMQIIGDNDANANNGASITVGSGQTVNLTFVNWVFQSNKK